MSIRAHLPGYHWFHFLRNATIRTGVYTGVCLATVFTAWLLVANLVPVLDRFALGRNLGAAALLFLLVLVPVIRFLRSPGRMIFSGLIAWSILTLVYRVLCIRFHALSDWHSTFQIFMYGAVVYMIVATVCWIGCTIWKAREAHVSHPKHHAS
jgi:hypothetical protein